MPRSREVLLFLHAGRLVVAAQPIRQGRSVPQALSKMCRMAGLPSSVGASEGYRAVARAATRLGRLGFADTCLVRSIALAALLADHDGVRLHLGFRPSSSPWSILRGHAWVSLADRVLPDDSAALVDGQPGQEVTTLRVERRGR